MEQLAFVFVKSRKTSLHLVCFLQICILQVVFENSGFKNTGKNCNSSDVCIFKFCQ